MRSLRPILLAEDNPHDIELILTAFEEARIANDIIVAHDGVEALDVLHRRGPHAASTTPPPALVLLDLKMPRIDGREVLRQIRADPGLHTLPVVVLTSSREESDLLESYQLGVNAYVVKPVNFEDFLGAVSKLGVFWALLNEPPPARAPATRPEGPPP
jgi:CheY-like chemotaxis protein